jgi:hypothetical protein
MATRGEDSLPLVQPRRADALRASVSRRLCTNKKETPGEAPGVEGVRFLVKERPLYLQERTIPIPMRQRRNRGPRPARFSRAGVEEAQGRLAHTEASESGAPDTRGFRVLGWECEAGSVGRQDMKLSPVGAALSGIYPLEQLGKAHAQGPGQLHEGAQTDVFLAPFNPARKGPSQVAFMGKALLGPAPFLPELAHPRPEFLVGL